MRTWILRSKRCCWKSSTIQASRLIIIKTKLIADLLQHVLYQIYTKTCDCGNCYYLYDSNTFRKTLYLEARRAEIIHRYYIHHIPPQPIYKGREEGSLAANGRSRMRP